MSTARHVLHRPGSVVAVAAIAVLAGCGQAPPPAAPPQPPARSVLLLVVDTLPVDTLGCYGNPRDTSPVIDALADRGMLCERVYAPSNWTVPSTASLLTSLYPTEHGAVLGGDMRHLSKSHKPSRLEDDAVTLAEVATRNGMRTALFSANPYLAAGMKQGYQTREVERMPGRDLTDLALAWLGELEENRFVLHLQYMDLHIPVEPPAPFATMFAPDGADMSDPALKTWSFGRGEDAVGPLFEDYRRRRLALHDGAMRFIDTEVGRILDLLASRGWLQDTLMVVTSDHGEEFWQHARFGFELGNDPRDLYGIGHGHAMFEEVVRVPLILAGPRVPSGVRVDSLLSLVDVAPTVLSILDIDVPATMRGRSLVTAADDRDDGRALLIESPAYGPDATAIVFGRHKLVVRADGVELLFDLERDPDERTNLITTSPETANAMRRRLHDLTSQLIAAGEGQPIDMDEAAEEQLRALGYLD
jgi:arylsulfatase A-like enzyme